MDRVNTSPNPIHRDFATLAMSSCDKYTSSEDCLANLGVILSKLATEDTKLRTYRRALGFSHIIKDDLLPLLIYAKDDNLIVANTISILVKLTIPVECLLRTDKMLETEIGRNTIFELNKLLVSGKEAFLDPRSTKAVLEYIKQVMQKNENKLLSDDECEIVNDCLLLFRNVLHIPDTDHSSNVMQNQILWNLFSQGIDKVLIKLMISSQKMHWGVSMVQLIALIYKDQQVATMQKLLNLWFEASLSDSSEDNESNTSPPDQGSGDSSPMLTSDPTSDSSDNGSSRKINRMINHNMDIESTSTSTKQHSRHHTYTKPSNKTGSKNPSEKQRKSAGAYRRGSISKSTGSKDRQSDAESGISSHKSHKWYSEMPEGQKRNSLTSSEISDCGYATQCENKEASNSTSSNEDEDPQTKRSLKHQKIHTMPKNRYATKPIVMLRDKKEWHRKKLGKRSRTTNMNLRAMMHHVPTDDDISNLLKEFTVDFLLKAYGSLVKELHTQLLNDNKQTNIDTSHFFWLVTYFLKFAAQLELELDHLSGVLTFDIISYLTYEGVNLYDQLEQSLKHENRDARSCVRKMHLVVTAIREFIETIEMYRKIAHLSQEDIDKIILLQLQIGSTQDLRCLFVLLLQQYNPKYHSRQYLRDLITTNHKLLRFLDEVSRLADYKGTMNIAEHIDQFATVEVMCQYGILLEDYEDNDTFINDCIFTMMHHVCGDLDKVAVLFQPNILKTFSLICEMDFDICEDWSDMIEYVMYKFINISRPTVLLPQVAALIDLQEQRPSQPTFPLSEDISNCRFASKELLPICLNLENNDTQLKNNPVITKRNEQSSFKVMVDIYEEEAEKVIRLLQIDDKPSNATSTIFISKISKSEQCFNNGISNANEIETMCNYLLEKNKGKSIVWLQSLLIEACYVKLKLTKEFPLLEKTIIMEPITHHYTVMKRSIPIVPWNSNQKSILLYQPFVLLLDKIGLHLPDNSNRTFTMIPHFWTANKLYDIAGKLGPINAALLKFDTKWLRACEHMFLGPDSYAIEPSVSKEYTVPPCIIQFTSKM